jgi:hypothetical protein
MWRTQATLKEQNRLLTERVTALSVMVNERDEHIRALTQNAIALEKKLQQRDLEIGATATRLVQLEKYDRVQIVIEARRHLAKALSDISPDQPSYGSRWQPQIDAIRRDIPALTDSVACLHYAQKEITFDGRPQFPSDPMQIQFREWAVENEFPNLISTLRHMYDNPLSDPEILG